MPKKDVCPQFYTELIMLMKQNALCIVVIGMIITLAELTIFISTKYKFDNAQGCNSLQYLL